MNEKEISEIRRRYRPDKNNISHIRGCYVNEKREIVSEFNLPLSIMPSEEIEKMLVILKRTLSGTLNKNLIDITFDTKQVADSDEHRLLMALRSSALKDDVATQSFFKKVIDNLVFEGNYLILLAHDTYDVAFRSADGQKQEDASTDVFSYILCSICPTKMTKPELGYHLNENLFHNSKINHLVASPELGFMFPAFDDRSANIYDALYYSRNTQKSHQEFVDAIFNRELPMPAAEQKEVFQAMLGDTLADECNYEVVQAVHEQLCELIEEHKANKEDILVISKNTVKKVLEDCGVSEAHVTAFDEKYDTEFGSDAQLSPLNIVDTKHLEVRTPDVTIHVSPACSDLVETRIIDGAKYIMIRANDSIEVNGVNIHI